MPSFLLFLNGYNDTEKASTHLILAFRNVRSTRLKVDRQQRAPVTYALFRLGAGAAEPEQPRWPLSD